MTSKVFISHSSIDTWVARQIGRHINDVGSDTFLDEADIDRGDDFEDEIVKAAKECTELLVLLTPWSATRPYTWLEIGLFRHDSKRIVAILYGLNTEDVSTDKNIRVLLKKLDLVRIDDIQSYLDQLARRVKAEGA